MKKIITCLTWNLGGQTDLADKIIASLEHEIEEADLTIISFQEYIPLNLTNLLFGIRRNPPKYFKQLGGLVVMIFTSNRENNSFEITDTVYVPDTILANKGSILVTLDHKYGVIASHLDAHSYEKRNRSYQNIVENYLKPFSWFQNLDWIIWLGDLNYRLIHVQDELRYMQKQKLAFDLFSEPAIRFPVTYKYDLNTHTISNLKKRGWCDRILRWVNKKRARLIPILYSSLPEYVDSDHKPVMATFEMI